MVSIRKRARSTEITLYVHATIIGFLLGELWYFAQAIASALNNFIESSSKQGVALIACGLTALIISAYCYVRDGFSDLRRIGQSYRFDLLALVGLGMLMSVCVGGVGTAMYQEYVGKVPIQQLMLLVSIPVAIALMLISRAVVVWTKSGSLSPFFISDRAIQSREDDLLGLSETANRFAERVLNGGSSDSLVFGVDAPWGIGKSSFVNFCCEYWQSKPHSQIIVHRFEPLRYDDKADLANRFVNDLVNTIQTNAFVPSIRPVISKYFRLIKGDADFSFLGMKFSLDPGKETVDDTLKRLELILSELNKKIVIVVDDLDRLSWSAIKNILFAIKRSFMLPNVAYVLCYDTGNIVSMNEELDDAEKVREFLEKFVNVKISLFLDSSTLANYVSTNFDKAVRDNLQLDPHTLDQIKGAIKALVKIYESDNFASYQELLGDIRKLKRLINTLVLFEIEKTDFDNSDFNKEDLVHLLLVYVNYPSIFRKIYNTETNGKGGFFSLNYQYTSGSNIEVVNSKHYIEYLKLLTGNQRFLLSKLFDSSEQAPKATAQDITEAAKRSRACFNGQGGSTRNLERYLNLIVKLSKPDKRESYQFYVNRKDKLLQGKHLDLIFEEDEFDFSKGDFTRNQLWRVIANSANELGDSTGSHVVAYLMEHLPEYSILHDVKDVVGSRTSLTYSLLKLLDQTAWGSKQKEDASEIADWVFGEGSRVGTGVVNTLAKTERGPLGLFDLMLFRLYCSADRGGSLFSLQRALSLHGDPAAPISGPLKEIAREGMREISQSVFQIFKSQYIAPRKNIFEAIDNLSLDDFAGKCSEFVHAQIKSGQLHQDKIDHLVALEKSRAKVFIVYQMGNAMINSGVGCGFYDETGNSDNKGISVRVNEYLFDICFSPSINQKNYEVFLDYLLLNLGHTFESHDGNNYVPSVDEFTKVIDKERLKVYWTTHKKNILALDFYKKKKQVTTANYIATYKDDLGAVYRVLDELIS